MASTPSINFTLLPAGRKADHGTSYGDDALPAGLLGSAVAHPTGLEGDRPVIPRSERVSNSNADGPMVFQSFEGIHVLYAGQKARGFEHERTSSNGGVHSGAEL